jgi:glycosyltransferase involved in cell wall biosynthesis
MVTGAYYPEVSGGGLQCRELVHTLRDRVIFTVLTTTADPLLPTVGEVDGVTVYRVVVDVGRFWSKFRAALCFASTFFRLRGQFDIVHLHSFSQKSLLLILLARLFRKKLMLKLTSVGYDDPLSIRRRGRLAYWFYRRADLFCGVSPRLQQLYHASGLPEEKFWFIPNGVDLERFRPGNQEERRALRRELGLPEELLLILFVGFFSREKGPDLLFEAWTRVLVENLPATGLVFVGATRSRYYEVDPTLVQKIRAEAQHLGVEKHLVFVEVTHEIEKYYRTANVFVLPSIREGLPNALLEAMATGLPCVASRLSGVTDLVIDHELNGLLFPPGDVAALEAALRFLLREPTHAQELGKKARETVAEQYSITRTAARCLEAYRRLTGQSESGR